MKRTLEINRRIDAVYEDWLKDPKELSNKQIGRLVGTPHQTINVIFNKAIEKLQGNDLLGEWYE